MNPYNTVPQIDITTTVGCAIQCKYCPQQKTVDNFRDNGKNNKQLSFELFQLCVDKIPKTVQINFAGYSEPFLNPSCTDMIIYANDKGHPITLYTTLVGLNLNDIDRLVSIPFILVDIHLPTILGDEKIITNEAYKRKLLIALECLSNASCVAMEWVDNEPSLPASFTQSLIIHKVPINSRSGNLMTDIMPPIPRRKGRLQCDRNLYANVLMPNGDVTICCQDFGLKHVIGNLVENSYENLFTSDEYHRIQLGLNDENADTLCRQCEYALDI